MTTIHAVRTQFSHFSEETYETLDDHIGQTILQKQRNYHEQEASLGRHERIFSLFVHLLSFVSIVTACGRGISLPTFAKCTVVLISSSLFAKFYLIYQLYPLLKSNKALAINYIENPANINSLYRLEGASPEAHAQQEAQEIHPKLTQALSVSEVQNYITAMKKPYMLLQKANIEEATEKLQRETIMLIALDALALLLLILVTTHTLSLKAYSLVAIPLIVATIFTILYFLRSSSPDSAN